MYIIKGPLRKYIDPSVCNTSRCLCKVVPRETRSDTNWRINMLTLYSVCMVAYYLNSVHYIKGGLQCNET